MNDIEDRLIAKDDTAALLMLLTSTEREIVLLTVFGLRQRHISQIVGLSQQRISQIHDAALEKMRQGASKSAEAME